MVDQKRPLRLAGIGLPLIDFITPTQTEFDAGLDLAAEVKEKLYQKDTSHLTKYQRELLADTAVSAGREIGEAKTALARFKAFAADKHTRDKDNGKTDLDEEESDKVAGWFETMLVAARTINRMADALDRPDERLDIRHIGSTTANKFHAIKAGRGDQVQAHLLGALGDEDESGNRKRLTDKVIGESQIHFQEFKDVSLGGMAVSYILQGDDGDRIAYKAHIRPLAGLLEQHLHEIGDFVTESAPDYTFIEGGDFSTKKFGMPAFQRFVAEAMEHAEKHGGHLVFAAPTDPKLILGEGPEIAERRALLDRVVRHPATTLLTFNESEAVAYFRNQKIPDEAAKDIAHYAPFQDALHDLQQVLKEKEATMPAGAIAPIALVTAGKEGAYYVTSEGAVPVKGQPPLRKISSIGAGDAFVGGAFLRYAELAGHAAESAPQQGLVRFTSEELQSIVEHGQAFGRKALEFKGAQVPRDVLSGVYRGEVSTVGTLAVAPPKQEKQWRMV